VRPHLCIITVGWIQCYQRIQRTPLPAVAQANGNSTAPHENKNRTINKRDLRVGGNGTGEERRGNVEGTGRSIP